MDPQTTGQAGGFNWNALIAQANSLALAWYSAIRNPQTPVVPAQPGTVSVQTGPGGISATVDPMFLVVGIGVVAVVLVLVLRK